MPTRTAKAEWKGDLKQGVGTVKLGSGAFEGGYSFSTRFEEGKGTNPEELIGAAHAACYSMALSAELGKIGFNPKSIQTTAKVHINKDTDGFKVNLIELDCQAQVPGVDKAQFQTVAEATKKGCPISKLLMPGTEVKLTAKLL